MRRSVVGIHFGIFGAPFSSQQQRPRPMATASFPGAPLILTSPNTLATVHQAREITQSHYMDRRTTAEYMGISQKFLATHLNDGPKRLKVGAKVLYRLGDVEDWMRQQEVSR